MSAVVELINGHRDLLNLSTDTDCFDGSGVNDVISYFEHNPLKYCVLVADAGTAYWSESDKQHTLTTIYSYIAQ